MNSYSYGSFKGDPSKWIEQYFDAFLYQSNWGTRELFLRLPARALPPHVAKAYCAGDSASARSRNGHVLLEFRSGDEDGGGEWIDEEDASLSLSSLGERTARAGKPAEAASRIARLREEHAKKGTLIERFRKAGLLNP